ncbi:acyl carrier protein [Bacillus sp. 166amftsu]|uniref:acyl carrier protein n=1 Tax=Bacillus sp. 166amftsu TaxID=1761753 RepID=UPI00089788EF|nr:acyl carrier protein [Bacillus sp. 166amftsu]SDZ40526.1 Acyl carrier protein [Bacillus sp. 166amftsu]
MHSKSEIETQIIKLIAEISEQSLNQSDIFTPFNELGVDSLMALELSVHIEREYNVCFDEEDLMSLSCINDIFTILNDRMQP